MAFHTNCQGMSRRDCLQLGVSFLAGGSFVNLLGMRAQASPTSTTVKKPSSCILIWMDGGPTHFETFDPKPDAPAEIRGEFEPISTKLPGVRKVSRAIARMPALLRFRRGRESMSTKGSLGRNPAKRKTHKNAAGRTQKS
jgi:hypothetical protein